MNVLLINCPSKEKFLPLESLGLSLIAATLRREGYQVDIFDVDLEYSFVPLNIQLNYVEEMINNCQHEVIGLSINDESYISSISIIEMVKSIKTKRQVRLVLGGYLPTFAGEKLINDFPSVDFIVQGEGEYTMIDLIQSLEGMLELRNIPGLIYRSNDKIIVNSKRKLIKNLDSLPFPARDNMKYVKSNQSSVAISSSRGCRGSCVYCSISSFYKRCEGEAWRRRSTKSIVDEIESIIINHNKSDFIFVDDEFIGGVTKGGYDYIDEFVNEITKRKLKIKFKVFCRCDHITAKRMGKLKSIGMYCVFLGVESFLDNRLKFMAKGLKAVVNHKAIEILEQEKIMYTIGFIPMDVNVSLEDIEKEYLCLKSINQNKFFIGNPGIASRDIKMLPYYGSPYFTYLQKRDVLVGDFPSYTYPFYDKRVKILHDSLSELDLKWIDSKLSINVEVSDDRFTGLIANMFKKVERKRRDAEIELVLAMIKIILDPTKSNDFSQEKFNFTLKIKELIDETIKIEADFWKVAH